MHPQVSAFYALLFAYLTWIAPVFLGRYLSRPGSLRRYVWNTWEKLLRYPAAGATAWPVIIVALHHVHTPQVVVPIFTASLGLAVVFRFLWQQHRGLDRHGDDDWFSANRRQRQPQPATVSL